MKITESQKEAATPTLKGLGKNIRKRRRDLEWSEKELSERVNCSRATVSRIEQGDYSANFIILIDICRELGIRTIKIED